MWDVIAIGSGLAGISQLLKIYILSESDSALPSWTRLLAYALSGAIGYFSWIQILINFWPDFATKELMLGTAGVIGWVGGDINLALGRLIQERLGIPMGIPPLPESSGKGAVSTPDSCDSLGERGASAEEGDVDE
jgi:hypothetical protein